MAVSRIVFVGDATDSHAMTVLGVAQAIHDISDSNTLVPSELYFYGPELLMEEAFFEQRIVFKKYHGSGMKPGFFAFKKRIIYFFDVLAKCIQLFFLYPDVICSIGGVQQYPLLVAARILGIPVILFEGHSIPQEHHKKFSKKALAIATVFDETYGFFEKTKGLQEKTADIGQPVPREIDEPIREGASTYLVLENNVPTLLALAGSRDQEILNDVIMANLSQLMYSYQIVHEVGQNYYELMKKLSETELMEHAYQNRYRLFGQLNPLATAMGAGIADVVLTRGGAELFLIAQWGLPAIVVPYRREVDPTSAEDAYNMERQGACVVIEEDNFTEHVFDEELRRLLDDPELRQRMGQRAKELAKPKAAKILAQKLLDVSFDHQ